MAAVRDPKPLPHVSANAYYGYGALAVQRPADMETDENEAAAPQQHCQAWRPSRKRSGSGFAEPPLLQNKRFRDGRISNGGCYQNTGSTKKSRFLATLSNDSQRFLSLSHNNVQNMTPGGCCEAAGKYRLVHNGASKNIDKHKEYEDMLLETHGCSVYHHYRQQQSGCETYETEF